MGIEYPHSRSPGIQNTSHDKWCNTKARIAITFVCVCIAIRKSKSAIPKISEYKLTTGAKTGFVWVQKTMLLEAQISQ